MPSRMQAMKWAATPTKPGSFGGSTTASLGAPFSRR